MARAHASPLSAAKSLKEDLTAAKAAQGDLKADPSPIVLDKQTQPEATSPEQTSPKEASNGPVIKIDLRGEPELARGILEILNSGSIQELIAFEESAQHSQPRSSPIESSMAFSKKSVTFKASMVSKKSLPMPYSSKTRSFLKAKESSNAPHIKVKLWAREPGNSSWMTYRVAISSSSRSKSLSQAARFQP